MVERRGALFRKLTLCCAEAGQPGVAASLRCRACTPACTSQRVAAVAAAAGGCLHLRGRLVAQSRIVCALGSDERGSACPHCLPQ